MRSIHLLLAASALATTGAAQAAVTIYTDEASFLAAISNPGVDDYNDLPIGVPVATPQARTAGDYTYSASSAPNSGFYPGSDDGDDVFLTTDNRLDTITLANFSAGVFGIGGNFFGSDLFGFSTAAPFITLTVTDSDGTTTETILNPTTGSFRGFVSTGGLSSLTVNVGDTIGVWPSVDNLTLGGALDTPGAVPEPASWAMMISGFGLVGGAMRRRRTSVSYAAA
jgi:hypothetical protein